MDRNRSKEVYLHLRQNINIGIEDIFLLTIRPSLSEDMSLISSETDQETINQLLSKIKSPAFITGHIKGLNDGIYKARIIAPDIFLEAIQKADVFNNINAQIGTWIHEAPDLAFDPSKFAFTFYYEVITPNGDAHTLLLQIQ